jgi:hypothetical protein
MRFIGKRYKNSDRDSYGSFSKYWCEFFQNGLFAELEKQNPEFCDYFGLMGCSETDFEYWIGMFFPVETAVPEGYSYVDMPESDVGICWIMGKEETGELFGAEPHNMCMQEIKDNGMTFRDDFQSDEKWLWFFERYNCPRYTQKAEDGTVILDYGVYVF